VVCFYCFIFTINAGDILLVSQNGKSPYKIVKARNADICTVHAAKEFQKFIEEKKLTALMVTHNMKFAIAFGTRLIMMDEGKIILDVKGEEKKKLTVEKLLEIFKNIKNEEFANDEGLLTV